MSESADDFAYPRWYYRHMAFSPADLKMVDDHIAEGERHVTRQEELVAWLTSRGHPTDIAEQLLAEFQSTLAEHRAHRQLMLFENRAIQARANAPEPIPSPAPVSPRRR